MMKFTVTDMTCGHCVSMITKAILQLQADAQIEADVANKIVSVDSDLTAEDVTNAIKSAGYMATAVKTSCCNPANSCHL